MSVPDSASVSVLRSASPEGSVPLFRYRVTLLGGVASVASREQIASKLETAGFTVRTVSPDPVSVNAEGKGGADRRMRTESFGPERIEWDGTAGPELAAELLSSGIGQVRRERVCLAVRKSPLAERPQPGPEGGTAAAGKRVFECGGTGGDGGCGAASAVREDCGFCADGCRHRLICFDMDSTLLQTELMNDLGVRLGIGKQMREITERTMRGELDFSESFACRAALLKGLKLSVLDETIRRAPLAEGLESLMADLKEKGIKTAVITGGFTMFGRYLQERFGFDYIRTTDMEVCGGRLTGCFAGPVLDGEKKAGMLESLCRREGISLFRTAAVGDGANDLPMLAKAGTGIVYHAGNGIPLTVLRAAGIL